MAKIANRLSFNVPGEFFVDSGCIDCGVCQRMAPGTFDDAGEMARVFRQPEDRAAFGRALGALVSCPVSAIGTLTRVDPGSVESLFPERIDGPVFECGFTSPKSFGAMSYLIQRPGGNILVDSPRFAKPIVDRLEALGGVALLFLTHSDDVADHEKFHRHFGCERILHEADSGLGTRGIERLLTGQGAVRLDPDLLLIPTPGHTPGSTCLLFQDRYLFTGDHLSYSPAKKGLRASRRTCWYSWKEQIRSMERLASYHFEWVLPGHGWRIHYPAEMMEEEMARCLGSMALA